MPGVRFALIACLLAAGPAVAGVYGPDEKCRFAVKPDGSADELVFGLDFPGPFRLEMDRLADLADVNPARKENPRQREAKARAASRAGTPAAAADLLRTRQADAALNLLSPLARGRGASFEVLANLAHAHALRGEWADAAKWHEAAVLDTKFPAELPGTTPAQRAWLERIELRYYSKWLRLHRAEAAHKTSPDREDVFPLFDVTFVDAAGRYDPAEVAKLPPDAVAIVQQLLFWDRDDTRLFWLLAELYAAGGKLREAEVIFDQCASEARLYSNRKILMDHRAAVKRTVAALPPPPPAVETDDAPPTAKPATFDDLGVSREKLAAVGGLFAVAAALLLAFQVRAVRRRWGGAARRA